MSGGATYTIEGVPLANWKLQFAMFPSTQGDYFHTMNIPLLEGRTFTVNDRSDAPLVVIINQSMAQHAWAGQQAIGKRMHVGNPHKGYPWATVVGIVADTKLGSRDEPSADQWYYPAQQPAIFDGSDVAAALSGPASGYVTLRSALPPEQMI
jgi:MacB-like periplasmic core domain